MRFWRIAKRRKSERSKRHLELAHQFECLVALRNFCHRELSQALEAERFHTKTGHHASVNHRFTQIVEVDLLHCAGEISGHAAGKCVPCPGRIVNVLKRVSARTEELIAFAKEQCAVRTLFYRNVHRPHLSNATPCLDEAGLLRYFPRFAVIQDEKIDALKQRIQVWSRCFDPKVHCVSDHETWLYHLVEHVRLQ